MIADEVATALDGTRVALPDAVAHVEAAIAAGASRAHVGDLALAFAVGAGDAEAIRRFEQKVAPDIVASVRSIDRDRAFVDEIAQATRVHLVVGDERTPARIASYRGTGPLRAWVAITARRLALNAKRQSGARSDASDDVLADLVDREPDPELRHLRTLYRADFREALAGALAGLPDRGRAILRLRFVEGLELAQIGRLYRVHESTASRWVADALERVERATREALAERLSVTPATAASVARMVQSGLDLSVARLLG